MRWENGAFLRLVIVLLSLVPEIVGLSMKNADSRRNGSAGSYRGRQTRRYGFVSGAKPTNVAASIASTKENRNEGEPTADVTVISFFFYYAAVGIFCSDRSSMDHR